MARKVYISSDISIDERLIEVGENNPLAALIWPWILTSFDDWGRSEANPKRLKAKIFPSNNLVTVDKIKKALQDYAAVGLIELYEIEKKLYMAVPSEKWFKYQTHIRKEKRMNDESKIPAPPENTDSRDCAQMREDSSKNIPSPSTLPPFHPSPSDKYIYSDSGQQETELTPQLQIFNHWNTKEIIKHKTLDDKTKRAINSTLNNKHTPEEIMQAIDNYHAILTGDEYYFSYKWTLKDFLNRGLEKFIDFETAANNYKDKPNNKTPPPQRRIRRQDMRDWENI